MAKPEREKMKSIFKKLTALTLAVLLLAAISPNGLALIKNVSAQDIYGEEMLSNGSFEDELNGWEWNDGFSISNETAAEGEKSFKYEVNDNNFAAAGHASIAVKQNTWYSLSASFYRSDENQWLYVDMSDIAGEAQVMAQGSGEWETQEGLWYSGDATSVAVRIVCEKNWTLGTTGTGDYYIDAISLREVTREQREEMVYNGSFEHGNEEWNWIDGFDIVEDKASDGTHSIRWNGLSLSTAGYTSVPVEKNTWYVLSADFFRSDDDRWVYVDMSDISGEATVSAAETGKWESQQVLWYSGDNTAVSLRAVCEKNWTTGADGKGQYYIDNIAMYKKTVVTAAEFLDEKTISVTVEPAEKKKAEDFSVTLGRETVEIAEVKQAQDGKMIITLAEPVIMGQTYTITGKNRLQGSAKAKYISPDAITLKDAKFLDASTVEIEIDKSEQLLKEELSLEISVNYGEYRKLEEGAWSIADNAITLNTPAEEGTMLRIKGNGKVLGSVSAQFGKMTFPNTIRHDDYGVSYLGDISQKSDYTLLNEPEASFEFTFVGTGIELYGPKGLGMGKADVLIDGILAGEIYSYSNQAVSETKLFEKSGLEDGLHLVTVVKNRKNNETYPVGFSKAQVKTGDEEGADKYSLNGQWSILKDGPGSSAWSDADGFDFENAEPILVPGNIWEAFPGYNGVSWYGKVFNDYLISEENERMYLRFEAVQYSCDVYLNGEKLGSHIGSEVPFEYDVTDIIRPNEENFIAVAVSNGKGMLLAGSNTETGAFWDCGGIWQEVSLISRPEVYISDVYAKPDWKTGEVEMDITVANETEEQKTVSIGAAINEKGGAVVENIAAQSFQAAPGENTFTIKGKVKNFKLWDTENPNLYEVNATLSSASGRHSYEPFHIGFRHIEIKDGYYYLNGERFFLKMIHQNAYDPLIIQGTPRDLTYQTKALDNLKETGFNTFRTIGMAGLPAQLDYADEIGLLIYEESSQSWLGKNAWINEVQDELIIRDRNHPSIIVWGLLNEIVYAGDNRLDITRDYLTRLRTLDMTRPVAWNSGSFDYNSLCSHMSNSYSTTWDIYMGNESETLEQNGYYDGSLADTTIDSSKGYVGDLHFYPVYPLQKSSLEYLKTIGEGVNPVSITEAGTGSMFNPYNERDKTIAAGGDTSSFGMQKWVYPLIDGLDYFFNKYPTLSKLYDEPRNIIDDSDAINLRQRQILMSYIRANPQVNGYGLTSLSDAQGLGEGVMDNFRDWKQGYDDMLKEAWAPLRWCILLNNENSNVKKGEYAEFEVDIANEDVLQAGEYTAVFEILDKSGKAVYQSGDITFSVEDGESAPFAYEVWKGKVLIDFPEGEYTLKASLQSEDYAPTAEEMTFHVTDNSNVIDEDVKAVTVAGEIPNSLKEALAENGVTIREYSAYAEIDNEVILVGESCPNTPGFWRSLYKKVAKGAYASILNAEYLGENYQWFPAESASKPYEFSTAHLGSLYHNEWIAMEDEVLMDGLETGMVDPSFYGEKLTKKGANQMAMPIMPDEVNMVSVYEQGLPLAGYVAEGVAIGTYQHHNGYFTLSYLDLANAADAPAVERLILNMVNYGSERSTEVTHIDEEAYEDELNSYGFKEEIYKGFYLVNDDSPAIEYGPESKPGNGGADYICTDETLIEDYLKFTFIGNKVVVYSAKNIDLGIADVYIDGVKVGQIDYYAQSIAFQQVVFESEKLTQGEHTLEIRHTGQKGDAATGTLTPIDAIEYASDLPQVYDIELSCDDVVFIGETCKATATVQPKDAQIGCAKWDSSNPNIATVSAAGEITPISTGKTVISVMAADGSGTIAQKEITVLDKANLTVDIPVKAEWNLKDVDKMPEQVKIVLLANGEAIDELLLEKANGYKGIFEDVLTYEDGKLVELAIRAQEIKGVNVEITGNAYEGFVAIYNAEPDNEPQKPVKPSDSDKPSDDEAIDAEGNQPETGDENGLWLWIFAFMICAVSILAIGRRVYKKQ